MDIIKAASTLRCQLMALHTSDSTVTQLESHITSLGKQSLMSAIEDNKSQHIQLVLRLSVNDGVSHMYRQYPNRKMAEVQITAKSIKTSLEADSEQMTPLVTSSPTEGSISQDKAAGIWTSVFCEFSRCD